jgi:hypothetical protein
VPEFRLLGGVVPLIVAENPGYALTTRQDEDAGDDARSAAAAAARTAAQKKAR